MPGRRVLEASRATEGVGCDQPGQLQVIGVRFRRRLCPAELKCNSVERNYQSTNFGFPGSSHSFPFTLRLWFYCAELRVNRLQMVRVFKTPNSQDKLLCHWRPNRASSMCTSGTRADPEAAGRTRPGLPRAPPKPEQVKGGAPAQGRARSSLRAEFREPTRGLLEPPPRAAPAPAPGIILNILSV